MYAVGDCFVCYSAVCFESDNFVCQIYYQYIFRKLCRPSIQKFVFTEAHDVIVGVGVASRLLIIGSILVQGLQPCCPR